jgi:hypothetical protein
MEKADDQAELRGMLEKYEIPADQVVLMPQAQNAVALLEKSGWLVDVCKSEGYLFSTRLQILLWGNRRAV